MTPQFFLRRLGSMIVVLFVLAAVVFVLSDVSPEDPIRVLVGLHAPASVVNQKRKELGYDQPLPERFVHYVENAVHGNLGTSLRTDRPVASDIGSYLPASLELTVAALIIAVPLTLFFAVSSAARWRGSGAFRLGLVSLATAPPFLLAIAGILIFYKGLGWLPATGRTSIFNPPTGPTGFLTIDGILHGEPNVTLDAIRHLLLPAFALAFLPAVTVGRVLRGSVIENLRSDHVRAARARGQNDSQVMLRHCLRNSAGPSLAMTGLMVGFIFGGLIIVEPIFAWPGIGFYSYQSISQGDFPAIAGVTLLLGASYVIVNTLVDLLQAAADPRIAL